MGSLCAALRRLLDDLDLLGAEDLFCLLVISFVLVLYVFVLSFVCV